MAELLDHDPAARIAPFSSGIQLSFTPIKWQAKRSRRSRANSAAIVRVRIRLSASQSPWLRLLAVGSEKPRHSAPL